MDIIVEFPGAGTGWPSYIVNGVAMGVEFAAIDDAVWVALQDETPPELSLQGTIDAGGISTLTQASLDRGDYVFRIIGSISIDAATGAYGGTFSEVAYLYDDGATLTFGESGSVSGSHGALVWSGNATRLDTDRPGDDVQYVGFVNTGLSTTTTEIAYFGVGTQIFTLMAGTAGNDTITGGADADSLDGAGGNDNISGLGGNDTLDGGAGKDVLKGGANDDTYFVDLVRSGASTILQDTVTELVNAGADTLILRTVDGYTLGSAFNFTLTANVEHLDFSGTGPFAFNATGNALANAIAGNDGNNSLTGGLGNDTIDGGGGNDTIAWDGADEVHGGDGIDILRTRSNVVFASTPAIDGIEVITLLGGTGRGVPFPLDPMVIFGPLDDFMQATGGTLRVEGFGIVVAPVSGSWLEGARHVFGTTIYRSFTQDDATLLLSAVTSPMFDISGHVDANRVIGSDGNDTLVGGDNARDLEGGAGNDQFDGRPGAVSMAGGVGNDTFLVNSLDDDVIEVDGEGIDTVRSTIGITLADEVENLVLLGTGTMNGAGNELANHITGTAAANRLDGGAGADTMVGLAGNDVYVVDDLGDRIIDASGIDTVETGISWSIELSPTLEHVTLTGDDEVNATGNALANVLTGNSAVNVLTGLKGNDTYIVQNAGDVTVEALAGGTDVVKTTVTYALGDNVENLILQPEAGDIGGTGNLLVNTITGNTGNNTLDGAGGRDVLKGGAGNDTYIVDLFRSGAASVVQDSVSELANGGNDTLALRTPDGYVLGSAYTALLPANVENLDLSLTGALNINATGNTVANILVGNDGNNLLNGMGGADSLDGGGGNDLLVWDPLDTGYDGGAGTDTLRVDGKGLSLDFTDGDAIAGLEVINITGTGNNTLTLDAASVLALSGDGALRIDGNFGDVVNKGEGWTHGANQVIGANTYRTFTQGEATLLVDTDIRLPGPSNVPVGDAVALTGNPQIDGLTQGGAWTFPGDRIITYSLNLDDETPRAWTVALTTAIDKAFATWAEYLNVGFQRIDSGKYYYETAADLSIVLAYDALVPFAGIGLFPDPELADDFLASAGKTRDEYRSPEGDIVFNLASRVPMDIAPFVHSVVSVFGDLDPGEVGFYIMLHEIGHALGLKHPNDDGLNGRPTFDSLGIGNLDQLVNTLMVDDLTARGYFPATPMVLDVAAAQAIYGANPSAHAGDDIYHITTNLNFFPPGPPLYETIWDTGGVDTVVVDPGGLIGHGYQIDLRGGGASGPNSVYYLNIAHGSVIENAIGGAFNDHLIGNDGNNSLDGGAGADAMEGGLGNDTYVVDNAGDLVTDAGGVDTILTSIPLALSSTGNVENLVLTGSVNGTLSGNFLNNHITGNAGNNVLEGGSGLDTLIGGAGNDTLQSFGHYTGGAGGDAFVLSQRVLPDHAGDTTIVDFVQGEDVLSLAFFGHGDLFVEGVLVDGVLANLSGPPASPDVRLVYDSVSGILYHDYDGSGGQATFVLAAFGNKPGSLLASDFVPYSSA